MKMISITKLICSQKNLRLTGQLFAAHLVSAAECGRVTVRRALASEARVPDYEPLASKKVYFLYGNYFLNTFLLSFCRAEQLVGSQFPDQGSN